MNTMYEVLLGDYRNGFETIYYTFNETEARRLAQTTTKSWHQLVKLLINGTEVYSRY